MNGYLEKIYFAHHAVIDHIVSSEILGLYINLHVFDGVCFEALGCVVRSHSRRFL